MLGSISIFWKNRFVNPYLLLGFVCLGLINCKTTVVDNSLSSDPQISKNSKSNELIQKFPGLKSHASFLNDRIGTTGSRSVFEVKVHKESIGILFSVPGRLKTSKEISFTELPGIKSDAKYQWFVLFDQAKDERLKVLMKAFSKTNILLTESSSRKIFEVLDITNRKALLLTTRAGSSNRMKAMAAAAVIGAETNRKVLAYWPIDGVNASRFSDLYEKYDNTAIIDEFTRNLLIKKHRLQFKKITTKQLWEEKNRTEFEKKLFTVEPIIHLDAFDHVYGDTRLAEQKIYPRVEEKLKKFAPTHKIKTEVENFINKYFKGKIVYGIHYRSFGKATNDDNPMWWFMKRTKPPIYIAEANKIVEEYKKKGQKVYFFLATDKLESREEFKQALGADVVLTYKDVNDQMVVDRRSEDGNFWAALDFWTLAETKKIIGTNKSTFSDLAAILGGVEKIYVGPNPYE